MAKTPKRSHVKMIGKLVGGMLGTRIAEKTGQSGALGALAGLFATKFVRRSPIGALVIGGAWLGHKLYKRHQEREYEKAATSAKPVRPSSGAMKMAKPSKPAKSSSATKARKPAAARTATASPVAAE